MCGYKELKKILVQSHLCMSLIDPWAQNTENLFRIFLQNVTHRAETAKFLFPSEKGMHSICSLSKTGLHMATDLSKSWLWSHKDESYVQCGNVSWFWIRDSTTATHSYWMRNVKMLIMTGKCLWNERSLPLRATVHSKQRWRAMLYIAQVH